MNQFRASGASQVGDDQPGIGHDRLLTLGLLLGVVAALAVYLISQYSDVLSLPFVNDDYLFIEKIQNRSIWALWGTDHLIFHWYRPWSRELHYWMLESLFGYRETSYHLASWFLWAAVLCLFYVFARRISGSTSSAIATAGVAALALWGAPLYWVAGAQDLWMLLFCFLFLLTNIRLGYKAAIPTLVLALLSKETAAVLPALALAQRTLLGSMRLGRGIRETLPYWLIVGVWAVLHPTLRDRLLGPLGESIEASTHPGYPTTLVKTALAQINLESLPNPENGWTSPLLMGLAGAVVLCSLVLFSAYTQRREKPLKVDPDGRQSHRRKVWFYLAWTVIGIIPSLMPSIGWHAYYGILGSFGCWALLGHLLRGRLVMACLIISTIAVLRPVQADTPSWDWGTVWYQRRAGAFLGAIRAELKERHPGLPPHSRLFFWKIPNNIGLLAADGPAIRIWYQAPTIRAYFLSEYAPRPLDQPGGSDYFFRFDSLKVLVELKIGPEDLMLARAQNPSWQQDHQTLAALFGRTGSYDRAAAEYEKLSREFPTRTDYAYYAAMSHALLGDFEAAGERIDEVAQRLNLPPDAVREHLLANLSGSGEPFDSLVVQSQNNGGDDDLPPGPSRH